jgi:uncharacterized protein
MLRGYRPFVCDLDNSRETTPTVAVYRSSSVDSRIRSVFQECDVPLTVLAIADEVSRTLYDCFERERWKSVDCILSCGDLPPWYLDFLCSSLTIPVFYVRGNHDGGYRSSEYEGSQNIHGKIVNFKGLRIAGFEGSARYNGGPLQYTQREMSHAVHRTRLSALRAGVPDVLVTHAPPTGPHTGADVCHAGFDAFVSALNGWKPQLLIHGHMHHYDGAQKPYRSGATTILNAYPYKLLQIPMRPQEVAETKTASAHLSIKRLFAHRHANRMVGLTSRDR